MRLTETFVRCILILSLIICVSAVYGANDRPLIYGQNPVPTDWWGWNKYTYDPVEFDRMAEAGCTSCRIGVNWDQIERVKGTRDWSEIDRWIKLANDRNIEVVILINSTPTWALPPDINPEIASPEARYAPREDCADDFNDFVFELVRRYRGRVQYYEFWNEANGYGWHWDGGYNRVDEYAPWMKRAYVQVKRADPKALMSTTGLDDNGGHAPIFIRRLYDYGVRGYFDAVATHPYSPAEIEEWKISNIRSLLDSRGDNHVDIWLTEMGWTSNGRINTVAGWITDYFNKLVNNHPSVKIATYHTAMDFPWENYGYGLIDRYFVRKATWTAFKNYPKPARAVISNTVVTHLSPSSVRLTFATDVPTRAMVMYGTTDTYGMATGRGTITTANHSVTLTGLNPATTYQYRIRAGAGDYADSVSANRTFTTQEGSVVVVTSGPVVSDVTETEATISWTTNIPATAEVLYGGDFNYGSSVNRTSLSTNHSLRLTGLTKNTTYQYRVVSGAPGYGDASKEAVPFSTLTGTTWLHNGGFEDFGTGWTFWEVYPWGNGSGGTVAYPGHVSLYLENGGAFAPNPATREGLKRLTVDIGYASGVGGLYQTLNVPNGLYQISGWVAAGGDGGDELIELRAMDGPYTGGIPGGTAIAQLTYSSTWGFYTGTVEVTTGKLTVATRVSQFYAQGAVAGHFDGITVAQIVPGGVSGIKSLDLGHMVRTDVPKTVTMVVDPHTFYMQDDNRSSGIKVWTNLSHGLSVGQKANVTGMLGIQDGEVFINNGRVSNSSSGTPAKPLAMTNAALGGGGAGIQPGITDAVGLNNIGLLTSIWGKFTYLDNTRFTVDDGSGVEVLCTLPTALAGNPGWEFVSVTGISSCYQEAGEIKRRLRVRSTNDIVPVP